MGVIIKYLVQFPDTGLAISSDGFASGGFILDATITCKMTRGTASSGSSFEIRILNLPTKKGKELAERIAKKTPTNVTIKMGYADGGPFETVMEGLVDKVRAIVETDDLTTIITGKEYATHALQRAKFRMTFAKDAPLSEAFKKLVAGMEIEAGERRPTVQVDSSVTAVMGSHSIRGSNVMEELQKVAEIAQAELLVVDGKVLVGNPVKVPYPGTTGVARFDRDVNLGTFESFAKKIPGDNDHDVLKPLASDAAQGFTFQVTGDPNLRPGQKVFASVDDFDQTSGDTYRIASLVHKFGPKDGYICQGDVLKVNENDPAVQRKARATAQPTAQSLIDALSQLGKEASAGQGSVVEIGKVKDYSAPADGAEKHVATLYYGQTFAPTETQPSIHVDVEVKEDQVLDKKPFISPFAWHKCGLVVPVYKDMKAVIAHNRGLGDDALVAGFIWSEKPVIEPPASKAGDWWLCLPADYDGAAPPSDSTKAANDMTANNGKRVIEVKGLKITIGTDKLGNVGVRPTEGDDNVFLIEHKSGTSFQIADDGTLTITATKISIKGDMTIEGNVDVK